MIKESETIIEEIKNIGINKIYNIDCLDGMRCMKDNSVDFTLTDIPYGVVNRSSNGLRNLDKKYADIETFNIVDFLNEVYRVTKNSICVFCGKEQFSEIYKYFADKKGTVRPIVWRKTNPSPMNGQYIYLSGVELAVWFKKTGAKVFNAHCKNSVFDFPNGKRIYHPTQKNLELFKELIIDNTNPGDIVFDPCMGSGTTAIASIETHRQYVGYEINNEYYIKSLERLWKEKSISYNVIPPQQITLENKESWNDDDLKIIKTIFPYVETIEDCIELWKNNYIIRIADANDYDYAYKDYFQDNEIKLSFIDFVEEFKKGYGNSDYVPIARLFALSNGIWYDNEYCN